jgi:hypothetical protein
MRSLLRLALFAAALASLAAVPACSAPADEDLDVNDEELAKGGKAAQMNDVTIVMPLAESQSEFDKGYLAASANGVGGALLPKALYTKEIPDPVGPVPIGSDVSMRYANLRVVAVRLDPCFANVGPVVDDSKCDNQLRVIFQSLSFQGGGTSAMDGAVHAFYSLSRSELTKTLQEIIALRIANKQTTSMGALKPHPLLAKQGLDGAFGLGLQKILLSHAGASNLTRFTHFASSNLATVWAFKGFDVKSGATTPMVIPTLASKQTSVSFFAGFAAPIAGGFTPETTSKDDVAVLVNVDKATKATSKARQGAFDASLRIDNPGFHSPNTIDCASCHVAESARLLMGVGKFQMSVAGNANAFVADPKFVSATSLKSTAGPTKQTSGFNVHMLSYKFDSLSIGQRVINETASVVAYANSRVLPQK